MADVNDQTERTKDQAPIGVDNIPVLKESGNGKAMVTVDLSTNISSGDGDSVLPMISLEVLANDIPTPTQALTGGTYYDMDVKHIVFMVIYQGSSGTAGKSFDGPTISIKVVCDRI